VERHLSCEGQELRKDNGALAHRFHAVYINARSYYLVVIFYLTPFSSQSEYQMRAEAEALVQSIKQSMGLLRRHL
jgi:hypothetical protein